MTSGVDSGEKTFRLTSGNECKFSSDSKARRKKRRHHLQLIHQYSISIQLGKKVELTAKTLFGRANVFACESAMLKLPSTLRVTISILPNLPLS